MFGFRLRHFIGRFISRILNAECRHNNRHFGQTMLLFGRNQHPGQFGIGRKLGKLLADFGQFSLFIQRIDFMQRVFTVPNHLVFGRFQKRKIFDVAQI